MSTPQWDESYDVVVVGMGAGGMAAALTAAIEGKSVLLLEKFGRVGGSSAISGGAVWMPLNSQSAAAGHPDTQEAIDTYMAEVVGNASPLSMQQTFLRYSKEVAAYLQKHTDLLLAARTFSPDYYPDRPGAAMGGRSLDPVEFDGRLLGKHFKELRDPLPEFMVLGGMMITMTDVRHLLNVTRSWTSWKAGMKLVLRYFSDRVRGYHRGTRLVLGNALAARLFKTVLDRQLPYHLNAKVVALNEDNGRISGVSYQKDGKVVRCQARLGVVVATGGFPWNPQLREQHYPSPTGPYSMAPAENTGDGIALAQGAGAVLGTGHVEPAFWAPVSLWKKKDGSVVRYPHLVWDRAKPGLMAVNGKGLRFVNESASYHDFVRGMYRDNQDGRSIPAWLVCDSPFMERWGMGLALPGGRSRNHLIEDGYLLTAATLPALAEKMHVSPDHFVQAATTFSGYAATGEDPEFGKGSTAYNRYLGDAAQTPNPCLGTLAQGPFYAVQVFPGDIGTAVGIRCNEHAQALDSRDEPIPGLYMAGNDMHSVMGGQYPAPGITLGPAMTFGWIAAQHIVNNTLPGKH